MAEFEPLTEIGIIAAGSIGLRGFAGDFTQGGWGALGLSGYASEAHSAIGTLGLRGRAGEFATGGWGTLELQGYAFEGIPDIEFEGGGGDIGLRGSAVCFSQDFGDAAGELGARGFAGDFTDGGWGSLELRGRAIDVIAPEQNPLWLVQSPGVFYMTFGYQRTAVSEGLNLTQTDSSQPIYLLGSGLGMGAEQESVLQAFNRATDRLGMVDALGALYRILVQEGFKLALDSVPSQVLTVELIDSLMLLGEPGTAIEASNRVAEMLAIQDVLGILAKEQLTSEAAFDAAFSNALTARQAMVDALVLEQTDGNTAVMTVVAEDTILADATPASILEAFNSISDSISFALTIRIGDTVFAAWVCNTENKAFSNYENYPFNSFFEMGGKFYGVAPDGIRLLEGATDDDDAIAWRIRTGLMNLGTGKLKQLPSAYFGLRTNGDMVLKVITTSDDGEKTANWYRLVPPVANVARESRIKIGRGIKSVYWQFELEGIDGADFALDSLKLLPVILDRRISGGSHGA